MCQRLPLLLPFDSSPIFDFHEMSMWFWVLLHLRKKIFQLQASLAALADIGLNEAAIVPCAGLFLVHIAHTDRGYYCGIYLHDPCS